MQHLITFVQVAKARSTMSCISSSYFTDKIAPAADCSKNNKECVTLWFHCAGDAKVCLWPVVSALLSTSNVHPRFNFCIFGIAPVV